MSEKVSVDDTGFLGCFCSGLILITCHACLMLDISLDSLGIDCKFRKDTGLVIPWGC